MIEGNHGSITLNGVKYLKDIIIHSDGSVSERRTELSLPYRAEYFHIPLSEEELDFLEEEKPEVVIVGAGFKAMMLATPRAKEILGRYESKVVSTQKAMEIINGTKSKFVAILHLTC